MSTNEQDGQRDDSYVGGLPEPYLGDRSEVQDLPVFFGGPRVEAAVPVQASPDAPVAETSANVVDAGPLPSDQTSLTDAAASSPETQPVVPNETPETPEPGASVDAPSADGVVAGADASPEPDAPKVDEKPVADTNDLLRSIAETVLAQTKMAPPVAAVSPATDVSQADLARLAKALDVSKPLRPEQLAGVSDGSPQQEQAPAGGGGTVQVGPGERVQINGGAALAQGIGALVGGTLAVAGAAARAVGDGARSVASAIRPGDAPDNVAGKLGRVGSDLPAVLPRLSEYRVDALEDAAVKFGTEADKFWGSSTKLVALRSEMDRLARERGLSIQDVVEKMKPGGDFAELREQFNAEVGQNPDTGTRKRAMDKALDGFLRQYGRAQEELANPEQEGDAHYDGLKARVKKAHDGIEEKASGIPAFANADGGLEQSHLERLREAVQAIMEKVREVAQQFIAMLRGKDASTETSHEHASP